MKVLHTSDWHLGKTLMEHSLHEDQQHALDQLTAMVSAEPHDLLVVSGDIFDRGIPPENAVRLLGSWFADVRSADAGLPIVMIAGNHDHGVRLAWARGLLAHANVHIVGEPDAVGEAIRITTRSGENAEVWALPFLWAGSFPDPGEKGRTQVGAIEVALARIHARQTPGHTQILLAHCFAQNGTASDSERTLLGQATRVDPTIFAAFDYVALGHLHRPQKVAPNAHYSGSLAKYSFSEVADRKGVNSVTVRAGALPVVTQKRLTPFRDMQLLTGELNELLTDPRHDDAVNTYVSVTLTQPVMLGNPMAALRKRFPFALHLDNPMAPVAEGSVPPHARNGKENDVGEDFLLFHKHLYGRDAEPDIVAAFQTLRRADEKAAE